VTQLRGSDNDPLSARRSDAYIPVSHKL
jgi:hypothetical protein